MIEKNMQPLKANITNHYLWGNNCHGWRLLESGAVSIIQENVPPGQSEIKHYHSNARQFFYILSGKAAMIYEDKTIVLNTGEGLEIPPGVPHQFTNESENNVEFLVISFPPVKNDRVNL